jgi:hypothetical protein
VTARGGDPHRADLDAKILAWMAEDDWTPDDERFAALALEVFRYQLEHCQPYRRFCEARGRAADAVKDWREIPTVPTGAFKEVALRSFPSELERATFRTSGTSDTKRGELHLDTLALYEASLLPTIRRFLFPEVAVEPAEKEKTRLIVLAPSPAEAPNSSLSHMFGLAMDSIGSTDSAFVWRDDELQLPVLLETLAGAPEPLALCGTAFAFVHLLEALDARGESHSLPPGSRIMETGGFKGRGREVPRDELYAWIERRLGVPSARIVNQYGMTELGSQFYDSVLAEPTAPRRKLGPPWARVRLVDPKSGDDARPGEPGVITIYDLANTGSVAAVATADLGVSVPGGSAPGFNVLGREPGAEERGCSIAADLMLGA